MLSVIKEIVSGTERSVPTLGVSGTEEVFLVVPVLGVSGTEEVFLVPTLGVSGTKEVFLGSLVGHHHQVY